MKVLTQLLTHGPITNTTAEATITVSATGTINRMQYLNIERHLKIEGGRNINISANFSLVVLFYLFLDDIFIFDSIVTASPLREILQAVHKRGFLHSVCYFNLY